MEIGKTFCGRRRTDGCTDGRTHLSSNKTCKSNLVAATNFGHTISRRPTVCRITKLRQGVRKMNKYTTTTLLGALCFSACRLTTSCTELPVGALRSKTSASSCDLFTMLSPLICQLQTVSCCIGKEITNVLYDTWTSLYCTAANCPFMTHHGLYSSIRCRKSQ